MTAVALPVALRKRLRMVSLGITHTGVVVHRSPWTGAAQTLSRGVGFWRGQLEVQEVSRFEPTDAAAIAAVFEQLSEPGRWLEIPHYQGMPDADLTVTAYAKGTRIATVTTAASAGQDGRFVSAPDGRRYRIRTDTASGGDRLITTLPVRVWEVGDVMTATPVIRAYPESPGETPATRRERDFYGPWAMAWRELP